VRVRLEGADMTGDGKTGFTLLFDGGSVDAPAREGRPSRAFWSVVAAVLVVLLVVVMA
jgi:hypothetical protein